jgi:hypothetical protein
MGISSEPRTLTSAPMSDDSHYSVIHPAYIIGKRRPDMTFKLGASLVLAFLLLCAQSYGLEHGLDLDAHESHEACELCLHLSLFDHAVVGADAAPPSRSIPSSEPGTHAAPPMRVRTNCFQARGPPSPLPFKHDA